MTQRWSRVEDRGVCTLTLERPAKHNALDTLAFQELAAHLDSLEQDTSTVGCVVVRGTGKSFCAGADLQALSDGTSRPPPNFKPSVVERLAKLRQPVVAAVHGICYTGGLELALACDFILADTSARFADTHGKWGLVGAWGMYQRLPRRIGAAAAKHMMMTSRVVEAAEAERIGLVDVLAPLGELDDAVRTFVSSLLDNSWHTNFAIKQLMAATDGMSLAQALAYEHDHYPGASVDHIERLAKFTRK